MRVLVMNSGNVQPIVAFRAYFVLQLWASRGGSYSRFEAMSSFVHLRKRVMGRAF